MPAAIFLASSFVMSFAAARRPGFDFEVDIGDSEVIGVADDVGDAAIFLDSPRWWEAALGHESDYASALPLRILHRPTRVAKHHLMMPLSCSSS